MFQATGGWGEGIKMPVTIFYHTRRPKLKLHIIHACIKRISALNPRQFSPPHPNKKTAWRINGWGEGLRRCSALLQGYGAEERQSWERSWSFLPSQPCAMPHHHRAGSSRRKPDSTHLHQGHLWIMQPSQNRLIKTLLLSLHLCLWIRKSLF